MKKIFILLLILCFMLTGCGKDPQNNANAKWDCVEYSSIEEMNEAASTNITSSQLEGTSDEWFGVISENIAQYKFMCNEEDWCIRASKDVDNDISGLYYDNIDFEKDITATYYNDDVYAFRFFNNDTQYVISLVVTDKEIARSYFDKVCNDFKTNITGVKSGYDTELFEDGDNVVYKVTMYNDDGTTMIMEVIYSFEGDKMVSILNNNIFETEELAKDYYDQLIEAGYDVSSFTLEGSVISSSNNSNVDFYSDMTKAEFIEQMESSLNQ